MADENTFRLYSDLAWLWPLWGNPDGEYADWCAHVTALIGKHSRRETISLLNMGCGGGKNVYNLKKQFQVTGIDISPHMLDLARKLNPECEFVQADMRGCDFGREFDAVLIDDAISYMTSREELRDVFAAAFQHLRAGGVMVVSPDETKETFRQSATRVSHAEGSAKAENVDVVFVENDYDPDPDDDTYEGTMVYLIREEGELRVETDHHLLGLFTHAVWRESLEKVGFEIFEHAYTENRESVNPDGSEEEKIYKTYACVKR